MVGMTEAPRMLRRLMPALAVALWLAVLSPGSAQLAPDVSARVSALVAQAAVGDRVSITVVDALTGRRVYAHQPDLALNPASNQKLVTAAAALSQLGADARFRTGLYGRLEGDAVVGGLYLRGFGDPSLRQADLVELARDLHRRGVRRVDEVVVDATYYDDQILPPAFEQQPGETARFRAPTGAVSVDGNAYTLRVRPGDAVGAPALVDLDGDGYFVVDNRITTSDGGAPNVVADQRADGQRMRLALRGSIPLGSAMLSYPRRIENPLPWSGHLLRDALRDVGIRVGGGVRLAATPTDAPLLAFHQSRPLAEIVTALGKQSDNFVAEMLFRNLGAERHRPGRVDDSVAAIRAFMDGARIPMADAQIVNGSGLYRGNLISSAQLAAVLVHAYRSPSLRPEYVAHLAIAGVDGTLEGRLRDLPAPRIVRAKTGTLNDAIALSGYVLGPTPDRVYAFSVLVNEATGRQGAARALADGVARALAEDLWSGVRVTP
jgi:D-alanyl-D-alanine carboxypeptidase/D-alanyl-D-alanine-endopeptidase (penicillin-binding protein 4)